MRPIAKADDSLYQPILDRYIGGENVPLSDVRQPYAIDQVQR